MLVEPKLTERVVEPVERNTPVVNVNPPKANVPPVKLVTPVAAVVKAAANVVVNVGLLIVNVPNVVLPLPVIVPVPTIVAVKLLNVPPLDNVKLLRFKLVAPGLNAVVPKFNVLNQLPVVNVCTETPLPVIVKLGLLVALPPVVPNVYILVIDASAVNPPVPVYVNPVAFVIPNTVVPPTE